MEHGGDLLTYENRYSGELVDFSSNINPLGTPKGLEQVLIDNFKHLTSYPDIQYRQLKKSIAGYLNCESKNILVGNGAVEIIDNFMNVAKRVIVLVPSFSEYEMRAYVHFKEVVKIQYNQDFSINIQELENSLLEEDLLIIGNPNNPTGLRIQEDVLIKIYDLVKMKNAYLLLDEAFFEFCPEDYDSIEIFKQFGYKNIGIIRAATKFFALPGIRLGYGCTSEEKKKEIEKIQLPWRVNTLANSAGEFIFNCRDYIKESKEYIQGERVFLLEELSKIEGIIHYHTHTNYILIKLLNINEEQAFEHFLNHGIVVRKCSSFKELGKNHIRVAVKDREKNIRLIDGFKNLTNGLKEFPHPL